MEGKGWEKGWERREREGKETSEREKRRGKGER